MKLQDRLNQLEESHDWQGLLELLEECVASVESPEEKAAYHLQLGRLLHGRFLQGVKALKHFQDAFKLNPALAEALQEARGVYWEIGKLNMVQKLLELQVKSNATGPELVALGDVYADLGDLERAAGTYAEALRAGAKGDLSEKLADVQVTPDEASARIDELSAQAKGADAAQAVPLLLRASRLARALAPDRLPEILLQAYAVDPSHLEAAALYEGMLVAEDKLPTILETQQSILKKASDGRRGALAFAFGVRWALWHQNHQTATKLIEESLKDNPANEAAFIYLQEMYGTEGKDWARVVALADSLADRLGRSAEAVFFLSSAALLKWQAMGDAAGAKVLVERLASIAPKHVTVAAYEAEHGAVGAATAGESSAPAKSAIAPAPAASEAPKAAASARPAAAAENPERVAELRAKLAEQEAAKRHHEYVKTLILLADAVSDPAEKAQLYSTAAELYATKFMNQAEATKAYEAVIAADPSNSTAVEYLRQAYEKRRDWEKLIHLRRAEAEAASGDARHRIYKELADLATERVKKPELCLELWAVVLEYDPGDVAALQALVQLYERTREYDKLADALVRLVEYTSDTAQKIQLLNKLGQIAGDRLKDDEKATEAYRMLLALDPQDRRAQEQLKKRYLTLGRWDDLEVFYAESGKWDEFIRVLETSEPKAETQEQRIKMLMKIAELWMTQKGKPDRAARAYEKVLSIEADNLMAAERLVPIYTDTNNARGLVGALEVTLTHAEDVQEKLRLSRDIGALYEGKLSDKQKAFERYLAAFQLDPLSEQTQADVERVAAATEGWASLTGAYKEAIGGAEKSRDQESATALRLRLGRVFLQELKDIDAALEQYHAVCEYDPENATALAALEQLYQQTERWQDLLKVYEKRRDLAASSDERKPILCAIADLYEQRLNKPKKAISTYQAILEDDPVDPQALAALDRLYRDAQAWDDYAQILRRRIDLDANIEEIVDLKYRLAQVEAKELGNASAALESYREILFLNADDERARLALEDMLGDKALRGEAAAILETIYEAREDWAKLVQALEILVIVADSPDRKVELLRKIAGVRAQQLGDLPKAFEAQARAVKLMPSLLDARSELEALAERSSSWEQLAEIYAAIAQENADPGLARVLATVYDQKLGKPAEAIAAYREVLSADPTNAQALVALDALFARQGQWAELAENLETRLALADSEASQLEIMLRLAALREGEMRQVEAAIEGYRQVLDRDSNNAVALAALERLGQIPEHELQIAEVLEPLYRQQGNYQKLIGVHDVQVRRSDDANHRVDLLHKIAALYEDAAGDVGKAFDTYARALAEDPTNGDTNDALTRLARVTGRFQDLASVLEQLAEKQSDAELGSRLYMAAAHITQQDVRDIDRAIALYRKVLAVDAGNLVAAQALEHLFRSASRSADLSAVLLDKASMLDSIDEKKAALYQAASLEEDVLGRQDKAVLVYQKILETDPEDVRSIDALINLYLRMEQWEKLLEVQGKRVELVSDADEKKAIYYQMGSVFERELSDVHRAIDVYQRVLELDPDDLTALGRLDVLYQAAGSWNELLGILSHEAELTADPAEAVSYQYRIAELYEKRLNDVARAVELYREILNIQTDHAPTLAALEGIKDGTTEALAAALVLEPVYDAMGEHAKLIGVLEVQARFAEDPFAQVDLLHRIARSYEDNLGNTDRAFDSYARAVAVDSANEDSLGMLERLGNATRRWPQVASLYDEQLTKLAEEPERMVPLALRLAQIYELQLAELDKAVARYQLVLGTEPENRNALRSLDRLFEQSQRWQELTKILLQEAEIGETPDEILEFKFRLGQVYERQLNDVEQAIGVYSEVLSAAPEHQATRNALERLFASGVSQSQVGRILEPLYQSSGEYEKLVAVHEAQLTQTKDGEERLSMYYRIAEDYEEHLGDPDRAFGVFARALREYAQDERTSTDIERLAGSINNGWERLANEYANTIESASAEVQTLLGKRLARVFEEELADIAKAEEAYRYVLTVDAKDGEALEQLDRIYTAMEQWAELAGVLEQRAALDLDTHLRVELLIRLGDVYENRLGQVDDAVRVYRKIFDDLEPANETAIASLSRIYESKEQWASLDEVYRRQLKNAVGDVEEADIRAKIARLASDRLGKIDEAVQGWKRVLELRGEDIEALGALADLYEKEERWAELTDVLERHFDIAESDQDRVDALTRRARLFSHPLGKDDEALETWQRVLDIDFANVGALTAIANIWRKRKNATELVGALHALIDRAREVLSEDDVVSSFRELGRTYSDELAQPLDAADAWNRLLETRAGDLEAIAELEKIYRADERWEEVVRVKMLRAAALQEPAEQVRELLEVTDLWKDTIHAYDKATEAFQRVLQIDPTHEQAFKELEKLHTAAGRWETLVEMYLGRLETVEEARLRSGLLRKIARVFDEHLNDKEQAFEALVNAFSEDYADDDTVQYLERVTHATEKWGVLLETANSWLGEQKEPRQRIKLCLRLGKWYGEDLGHPEWAQPYYQQVMQLDPNNAQVLRQMASIYRLGAQWQKMGEALTRALDVAVANEDRKVILCDLGELLEKYMDQVDQGIAYYKRALEIDPSYLPPLEALERLYTARDDAPELVKILSRKVESQTDSPEGIDTRLRLGELYEKRLKDPQHAAGVYREVYEADHTNIAALRGLERVYEALQKWTELVEVLERQLDVAQTERDRVEGLIKIAAIQEEQFLKADIAAQRLEQVLEIDPTQLRAYEALERCYRKLKRWMDLVGAYERHLGETADVEGKVKLYRSIAEVYADELEDADQAINAYQNLIDLEDTNIDALEAMARLYEKQGDAARAMEALTRVADLTADGRQRVDMYYRIGRNLEEKLGDRVQARARFEMALDLDPKHLPTLAALRTIAVDEADWDLASSYLDQEQEHTESPRARAKLLVELGKIRQEKLDLPDQGLAAFQQAITLDDDSEDAALPLMNEYVKAEKWAEAEPLAELLVRKAKSRDRSEQHFLNQMLGKIHAAQGHDERALKAFQTAHTLDVTDQETVRGIAEVSFRLKDWPSALSNYQKVLTGLGEEASEERAEVYYRLGCIKREQGQAKQAINNFEKALALNPEHRPTLEGLVELYAGTGEWKEVAAYKRQILDSIIDEEQRLTLLIEIGDVWAEKAKEPKKAIEAYEEARIINANSHVLLHKLLQLFQEVGDWQNMVDTIQSIADLEQVPDKKARYFYTMAQLYRDKLEDQDRAIELFNDALDLNADLLEAFERINKILTTQKNWKQLERQYRKMLHRVTGKSKPDLEFTLWHQLGLIYRDRIKEVNPAIEAFRMASNLRPGEITERQILSELYEMGGHFDDAVVEQQGILESDPLNVEPYRALYRLYLHQKAYDQAWCVAAAIAFMGKAGAEEQRFFDDHRPRGMLQVKGILSNDVWFKHLFHSDLNLYVSKIFEMIYPAALQAKIAQLKAQNKLPALNKKYKQDPATSTLTFSKTFGWASQVLGVQVPELYVRNDVPGAVVAVPSVPLASVAGQTVLTGFQPQELTFICGKHLAAYRGELYIRNLFPTQAELTIMLFAGVTLAAPNTPMPGDMAQQIRMTAQELAKYIQPVQLEGLRTVVKRFLDEGAKANVKHWGNAAEHSATRAGFVLCGDLEVAKKIVTAEPVVPGAPTAKEKMKDLLLFSVGEHYAALRRALGVEIKIGS
jgi:tetratricopeptide (TPR) repeat protein